MLATLWNGPGGTGFVFALLALISLGFLLRFVLPALILLRQLGRLVVRLLPGIVPTINSIRSQRR